MVGRFDTAATERITVRVPEWMAEEAEALVEAGEYPNKSEVHREALGELLEGDDE
ncbi:ribbon-helix-helix protein, CopG family [Halomicroarcula sp. S1AR25-4]|uniref:ribbon-helix-helix protein, CopG family n=1 Tax=Haloarcula sp. S1AR25-4 TaxID=2950538 RepID=UPI0028742997|nr:ribbon-helix-helix protein, CopG family [Halomicroarcula sp. S1AR25-4]MDS0280021.1 ribbon-helix-helix protein, CopG family [Halomicroarcula sp. S1AR25-4]